MFRDTTLSFVLWSFCWTTFNEYESLPWISWFLCVSNSSDESNKVSQNNERQKPVVGYSLKLTYRWSLYWQVLPKRWKEEIRRWKEEERGGRENQCCKEKGRKDLKRKKIRYKK